MRTYAMRNAFGIYDINNKGQRKIFHEDIKLFNFKDTVTRKCTVRQHLQGCNHTKSTLNYLKLAYKE